MYRLLSVKDCHTYFTSRQQVMLALLFCVVMNLEQTVNNL